MSSKDCIAKASIRNTQQLWKPQVSFRFQNRPACDTSQLLQVDQGSSMYLGEGDRLRRSSTAEWLQTSRQEKSVNKDFRDTGVWKRIRGNNDRVFDTYRGSDMMGARRE